MNYGDKMGNLYGKQQEYSTFWARLIEKFEEKGPNARISVTDTEKYLQILIGKGGIHFEWFLVGYPVTKFQVALHFEREDFSENLRLLSDFLNEFKPRKEEFKNDFEEKLNFGCHNESSTHMFLEIETDSMDDATIDWGVNTMIKFYGFVKPILDKVIEQRGL